MRGYKFDMNVRGLGRIGLNLLAKYWKCLNIKIFLASLTVALN